MSYAYLFKYIIIGDTGKWRVTCTHGAPPLNGTFAPMCLLRRRWQDPLFSFPWCAIHIADLQTGIDSLHGGDYRREDSFNAHLFPANIYVAWQAYLICDKFRVFLAWIIIFALLLLLSHDIELYLTMNPVEFSMSINRTLYVTSYNRIISAAN